MNTPIVALAEFGQSYKGNVYEEKIFFSTYAAGTLIKILAWISIHILRAYVEIKSNGEESEHESCNNKSCEIKQVTITWGIATTSKDTKDTNDKTVNYASSRPLGRERALSLGIKTSTSPVRGVSSESQELSWLKLPALQAVGDSSGGWSHWILASHGRDAWTPAPPSMALAQPLLLQVLGEWLSEGGFSPLFASPFLCLSK